MKRLRVKEQSLLHSWRTALHRTIILGCLLLAGIAAHAETILERFTIGDDTYTNVVVTDVSDTDIYIKHNGGVVNLKVSDLSREEYRELVGTNPQLAPEPKKKPDPPKKAEPKKPEAKPAPRAPEKPKAVESSSTLSWWAAKLPQVDWEQAAALVQKYAIVLAATVIGLFIFCSACLFVICRKVEQPSYYLVWFPLIQFIPMIRAAGLSAWIFILLLVPWFNFFVFLYILVQLCNARGKSPWWVLLAVVCYPLFLLYLAASK